MSGATREGTGRFAERHERARRPWAFRELGRTGLVVSALGFGAYRVDDDRPEHAAALRRALRAGVNLVDTSTNYADGGSERAIGRALAELAASGELPRDEVVIVSKAGYVQGKNLMLARAREKESPFQDVVRFAPDCWHCIHPDFLADQLGRSLARLGLERLDVELLHNPEYFLSDAENRKDGDLTRRRDEMDRRLALAFARLEDEADAGRIGWYGVSSNGFALAADDPEATSLARMVDVAARVASERGRASHRFAVAQMPANLLERGALAPGGALDVARERGIAVLVNRPLNAFAQDRLTRLADFDAPPSEDLGEAAARVSALESRFVETIAPALEGSGEDSFGWGEELLANAGRFEDALHWRQVESDYILPRVEHVVQHVGLHLVGKVRNDWTAWIAEYRPALEALLRSVEARTLPAARARSRELREAVAPLLDATWRSRPLSQVALGLLLGTPGVTSVLVGMRRERWVDDALAALDAEPPVGDREAWLRVAERVD